MDRDDFIEGWTLVEDLVVEQKLMEVGLSVRDIFRTIAVLFIVIVLLYAFILSALAAWAAGSTFESVMQSSFVVGTGSAIAYASQGDYEEELGTLRNKAETTRQGAAARNAAVSGRMQAAAGGGGGGAAGSLWR